MATHQHSVGTVRTCPRCRGTLAREVGTWTCDDCGYVPRHSAD